jgi:hypothetical protein
MSVTYSSRHETDGLVDLEWLEEKLPTPKEREAVVAALVECGLYEPVDGEHFRGLRTESNGSPNGIHADSREDSTRTPRGASRAGLQATPAARPGPSRPDPEHPRS